MMVTSSTEEMEQDQQYLQPLLADSSSSSIGGGGGGGCNTNGLQQRRQGNGNSTLELDSKQASKDEDKQDKNAYGTCEAAKGFVQRYSGLMTLFLILGWVFVWIVSSTMEPVALGVAILLPSLVAFIVACAFGPRRVMLELQQCSGWMVLIFVLFLVATIFQEFWVLVVDALLCFGWLQSGTFWRKIWGCLMPPQDQIVMATDFHKTRSWLLVSYFSGFVALWDTQSNQEDMEQGTTTATKKYITPKLKIKVGDLPVRCAKFVTTQPWIVTVSEDQVICVFHSDTGELIHKRQLHGVDWISTVESHPHFSL
jgi:hypothetical protein